MGYSPMQLAEAFIKTGELTDALDALNQQLETVPQDDYARRLRSQVL
ncbi:MAG: tetratricopeptide repeat protein, partial [Anaerolineae bacterium]|nr:tetratricopeptide repeat protein [Anaerolineae bacterium]